MVEDGSGNDSVHAGKHPFLLKMDLATFWRKRFVLLAVAEDLSLSEIVYQ